MCYTLWIEDDHPRRLREPMLKKIDRAVALGRAYGIWHYGEWWDRARLEQHYQPWVELAARGVGVHCGEGGAFMHTPHDVALRWLRDALDILRSHNIGYALWNFRGGFGILDSDRPDVAYEDWRGHRLDRAMLELLQAF